MEKIKFGYTSGLPTGFLEDFCDDTGALFSILKSGRTKHIDIIGFAYRQRDKSIMHEADNMELAILELLLYQDILNAGGFRVSSLSRFSKAVNYAFKNRKSIGDQKYVVYREISKQKKNDIISKIYESNDNLHFWLLSNISGFFRLIFLTFRKIEKMTKKY